MASKALSMILLLAENLSSKDISELISILLKKKHQEYITDAEAKTAEACYKYCEAISNAVGVWPLVKSRKAIVVDCKTLLVWLLSRDGYTSQNIGKAMEMDHSSVWFHQKRFASCDKFPKSYPDYAKIKKKVLDYFKSESL